MTALLYLGLAWLTGWTLWQRLVGPCEAWLDGADSGAVHWPVSLRCLFTAAASLWAGLVPLTVLTYGLAYLAARFSLTDPYPLLPANLATALISLAGLTISWRWAGWPGRRSSRAEPDHGERPIQRGWQVWPWHPPVRNPGDLGVLLTTAGWLLFAVWLMISGFAIRWGRLGAGYSIFSDFAPHTALVRSFAIGANWPTTYPHFANDGIRYHFLFYFLCGNLNYLGLPIDWAINLPSILSFFSLTTVLTTTATVLTGRLAAGLLTPWLFFMRSSLAFFTYLADLWQEYGLSPDHWLPALLGQSTFIGSTPRDDWGLWAINVYANQRHFLSGLTILLLVVLLFLPELQAGLAWPRPWAAWRSQVAWRLPERGRRGRLTMATLLLVLLPFWHGSALIATLIILTVMAVLARNRLAFALPIILALASAVLQNRFFTGVGAGSAIRPTLLFGFIAEDTSPAGLLRYLLLVTGLVLPLTIARLVLPGRLARVMTTAAGLMLILTFTLSLTPDVTVNHKYLMIMLMLLDIYLADLLVRLWRGFAQPVRLTQQVRLTSLTGLIGRNRLSRIGRRLCVIFLALMMTVTGLMEVLIYQNINRNKVQIALTSPMLTWIETQTDPHAVFVTAPYHYDSFFMSGRQVWLGHAYYAWSAGHDTDQRLQSETWLLAGGDRDPADLASFARTNAIRYLLIDDTLRTHADLTVDESFFAAEFLMVAEFPEQGNARIFDLQTLRGEAGQAAETETLG